MTKAKAKAVANDRELIRNSVLHKALTELARIKDEHRLVVIITHGFIDMMVNVMIERRCKNAKLITDDHRSYTHATKLVLLHEMGVLSDHHFKLLRWFNKLRNDFAHQPLFRLTSERLKIFVRSDDRDMKKFDELCVKLLVDIFGTNSHIIGTAFMPGPFHRRTKVQRLMGTPAGYYIPIEGDPEVK